MQVINENVTVSDSTGKLILSQLLPIVNASVSNRKFYASAYTGESPLSSPKYWLAFTAEVPPLGFNTYVISSGQCKPYFLSLMQSLYQASALLTLTCCISSFCFDKTYFKNV